MRIRHHKEYQTIRLFAILGLMTALVVLLFKVVLFAPQAFDPARQPAQNAVHGVTDQKTPEATK